LFSGRARSRTAVGARKRRPCLEALESRCLLSSINEFSLNSSNSEPLAITGGPSGSVWFADTGNSAIGVINSTTHAISEFTTGLTAGSNPEGIVYDPADGDVWFTEAGNPIASPAIPSAIGMIDPATHAITEFTGGLTANSGPVGITIGNDGNLWFTEAGYTPGGVPSAIGMINPTNHQISQFSTGLTSGSNPYDITAGPDGNLWFTEQTGDRIGTINLTSHAISEFSNGLTAGIFPSGIASGSDGNLWFTAIGNDGTGASSLVGTINPATHVISEFSTGFNASSGLTGITAGPDGNLWMTAQGSSQIEMINPFTHAVTPIPTSADAAPYAIAAGPDGNVWFT
jgi:streptogramin lyase